MDCSAMKQIEHEEQTKLIDWWEGAAQSFDALPLHLFAIPNGGMRNIIVAKRLKAEGVRSGVPDLFLALPRGVFHGLFIEMKKPSGGVVSKSQKEYHKLLLKSGYQVVVCNGFIEAKQTICSYLSEKKTTLF